MKRKPTKYDLKKAEKLIQLAQSEPEVSHSWGYNIGGESRKRRFK